MSRTVVTAIPDSRPVQTGLETDALPFDALMGMASLEQIEAYLGESLAFALGPALEVKVEPTADPVKLSVPDWAMPPTTPRVRQ